MTETIIEELTDEDIIPYVDEETEEENFTHIVTPPDNLHIWQPGMESKDIVFIARSRGISVRALCGFIFVPRRNPDKYPACEECMRIAGELMRQEGE